jgi:hypothetical protein
LFACENGDSNNVATGVAAGIQKSSITIDDLSIESYSILSIF